MAGAMKKNRQLLWNGALLIAFGAIVECSANAQPQQEPGHSIGTVTTQGDLIGITLDRGALGQANLFDLEVAALLRVRVIPLEHQCEPALIDKHYATDRE
jgi:hypothetical protein